MDRVLVCDTCASWYCPTDPEDLDDRDGAVCSSWPRCTGTVRVNEVPRLSALVARDARDAERAPVANDNGERRRVGVSEFLAAPGVWLKSKSLAIVPDDDDAPCVVNEADLVEIRAHVRPPPPPPEALREGGAQ